jgi:cyclophilin family peptidyl-prolyl cis-trans isomerase
MPQNHAKTTFVRCTASTTDMTMFINRIRIPFLLFLLVGFGLATCVPPGSNAAKNTPANQVLVDFKNPLVQRLYDFRDKHMTDSLANYLKHPEATIRYIAVLGLTQPDTVGRTIPLLAPMLSDKVEQVRIAAAYALGQTGSTRAEEPLLKGFVATDSLSEHQQLNGVILEAIGRCGSVATLRLIAGTTTYLPTDTQLVTGQCRSIYRFGQRKMTDPAGTGLMLRYVTNEAIPVPARLVAAHYFARTPNLTFDSTQAVQLAAGMVRATDPEIRLALARGLGKSTTGPAFGILSKAITTEQDWRVKCAIIQSLKYFDYDTVRTLVTDRIFDANPHVARTAAEFFVDTGRVQDADYYWRIASKNPNLAWPVQVALYQASNRLLSGRDEPESKDFVNFKLKELFQNSKDPYAQAACLTALGEFPWNYRYIKDKGFGHQHAAVRSAAAGAIRDICQKPNFWAVFGEGARGVRREMYFILREMVAQGDAGMIAEASSALMAPTLNFVEMRDSARAEDFAAALAKLKMPRDVEAVQAFEQVVAYFNGQGKVTPSKPAYNHPIDWTFYGTWSSNTRATVQTSKGAFVLEFLPEYAPGSVLNFVRLAKDGFFDNKYMHRVVPAFVAQGGCPRGDGYGAGDYTIRTEIGPVWYDQGGWVGMASAGFDTEGTQWFVTHNATPHLDGRYTIFARVVQGMDVVQQIQVGDVIQKVTF